MNDVKKYLGYFIEDDKPHGKNVISQAIQYLQRIHPQHVNLLNRNLNRMYYLKRLYGYVPYYHPNFKDIVTNSKLLSSSLERGIIMIGSNPMEFNANTPIKYTKGQYYSLWWAIQHLLRDALVRIDKEYTALILKLNGEDKFGDYEASEILTAKYPDLVNLFEILLQNNIAPELLDLFIIAYYSAPSMIKLLKKYNYEIPYDYYHISPTAMAMGSEYRILMGIQYGDIQITFGNMIVYIEHEYKYILQYVLDHNLFDVNSIYHGDTLLSYFICNSKNRSHIELCIHLGCSANMKINGIAVSDIYFTRERRNLDIYNILLSYIHIIKPDILREYISIYKLEDVMNLLELHHPNIDMDNMVDVLEKLSDDNYRQLLNEILTKTKLGLFYNKQWCIQNTENNYMHKHTGAMIIPYYGHLLPFGTFIKCPKHAINIYDTINQYLLTVGALYIYESKKPLDTEIMGIKSFYRNGVYNNYCELYWLDDIRNIDDIHHLRGWPWNVKNVQKPVKYYPFLLNMFRDRIRELDIKDILTPHANKEITISLIVLNVVINKTHVSNFKSKYHQQLADYISLIHILLYDRFRAVVLIRIT